MNDKEDNLNPDLQLPGGHKFDLLVYAYLEGTLGVQDAAVLKDYLKDPRYVKYFVEKCKQDQALYDLISSGSQPHADISSSFESDVWQELARYEEYAPAIQYEKTAEASNLFQEARPQTTVRKVNKTSLITAVISVAALLLMIAYVNLFPSIRREPVAILMESMNTQWSPSSGDYRSGDALLRSYDTIELRSGIAKLKFNSGAEAILEGPCKFSCISLEQFQLHSGKVYVRVPTGSEGFTVRTATSKIIDLGTEFGVDTDKEGKVGLYMYKGKASLITAPAKKEVTSLILKEGQARQVDRKGEVSEIDFVLTKFVRQFSSKHNFVWHGDLRINLADIVGGGNGFGTGQIAKGISLTSGKCISDFNFKEREGSSRYFPVPERPFVDGVFVPNAKTGQVRITSAGHVFKECPETSGQYYDEIRNGGRVRMSDSRQFPMTYKGLEYGNQERPLLYIHPNAGITFDLDAIRNATPGFRITSFHSRCFLLDISDRYTPNKASIFVLADGETKTKNVGFNRDSEAITIDIPLKEGNRYLTLIATDGGDATSLDWVGFAEPYLMLEHAE